MKKIKILLIEDNLGDARLIQESLYYAKPQLYEIVHVSSLREGLKELAQQEFTVVLADLSLGDSTGLDTLTELVKHYAELPIIVLSGNNSDQTAIKAVQEGAQDYLVKGESDGALISRAIHYAIERKQNQQQLAHIAQYDTLTNLPNRSLFMDRLDQAIKRTSRNGKMSALFFLDLDRFKQINDYLGHDTGDELLKHFAARLKKLIRDKDTVARLGGDEFTIILEELDNKADAKAVARKILESLKKPFHINNEEIFVTSSIGIALYPNHANDAATLIKNADTAMYQAKEAGRSTFQMFQPLSMPKDHVLSMENLLHHALERDEFQLYYRPVVDCTTNRILTLIVELRWKNNGKLLAPNQFLHILEYTGLIVPVGEWVLKQSIKQLALWDEQGIAPPHLSLQLSPRLFRQKTLIPSLQEACKTFGIEHERIFLELTEKTYSNEMPNMLETIEELQTEGFQIGLDRFASGVFAMIALKHIKPQYIKVWGSFFENTENDPYEQAILQSLLLLCHQLNISFIIDGVDNEKQYKRLRNIGIKLINGSACIESCDSKTIEGFLKEIPR